MQGKDARGIGVPTADADGEQQSAATVVSAKGDGRPRHVSVEVLVVSDCPHQAATLDAVRAAAEQAGIDEPDIRVSVVATSAEAQQRGFIGSPTVRIDGVDPFVVPGAEPGLACRIYATPAGPSGVPDVVALRGALAAAGKLSGRERGYRR